MLRLRGRFLDISVTSTFATATPSRRDGPVLDRRRLRVHRRRAVSSKGRPGRSTPVPMKTRGVTTPPASRPPAGDQPSCVCTVLPLWKTGLPAPEAAGRSSKRVGTASVPVGMAPVPALWRLYERYGALPHSGGPPIGHIKRSPQWGKASPGHFFDFPGHFGRRSDTSRTFPDTLRTFPTRTARFPDTCPPEVSACVRFWAPRSGGESVRWAAGSGRRDQKKRSAWCAPFWEG